MCLAIPGKIVNIDVQNAWTRNGIVDFGGVTRDVNLTCVPEAVPGDYVLVHVGMAISSIDAEEAQQVFAYLREIGELDELDHTEVPAK
jgi:hydrogenase expression/formation protein HypC